MTEPTAHPAGTAPGTAGPAAAPPVVVSTPEELSALRPSLGRIALVPTMGALHSGHRRLIAAARADADSVIVSIFVNPLQFGPGEDYQRYPRDLDADVAACAAEGVDVVFAPTVEVMYPGEQLVSVDPGPMGQVLEGEFRPGFFAGVLTVVAKLFHLVRPDTALFGQKDAQQLAVIRRMVRDLAFGITVLSIPTVRDPDGLATSSRNAYLSAEERTSALALSRALLAGADASVTGPIGILTAARAVLAEAEAATPPVAVDYLALVDPGTFGEVTGEYRGEAVLAVAARVGATRLIDNVPLTL
ncbi:pantothenate synthetase [Murinocardiopsis flavida]|uniref:Pantothenate synthetase n=1 Tax=Murinocardiopsis flavida TaxID=645275 RepID=A0A2P8D0Z9_9ACTN|nr:pantoate--beta-alanine ligase [Murinocardiopsis flavida]PSK90891.1 pantothenate synthetase [Murinocardiopsis flavida]